MASPLTCGASSAAIFAHGGGVSAEGDGWQTLSKADRCRRTRDAAPVIEIDYSAFHPTRADAEKGLPPPDAPYEVPGVLRDLVKIAFNVFLNSTQRHGIRHTLAGKARHGRSLLGMTPSEDEARTAAENKTL